MAVITMMALVVVLVLALLALALGANRTNTSTSQLAAARANARTALTVALGDLQRMAGPDQAATARSDIMGEKIPQRHLTGVWRSWKIDPAKPPGPHDYEKTGKAERFQGWLVSHPDRKEVNKQSYVTEGEIADERAVTLLGSGALGGQGAGPSVRASRIDLTGDQHGSVAWAVLDEGVKARVDVGYESKVRSPGLGTTLLGGGSQPGVWMLDGLGKVPPKTFEETGDGSVPTTHKWVSNQTAELGLRDLGGEPVPGLLSHDLTVDSIG